MTIREAFDTINPTIEQKNRIYERLSQNAYAQSGIKRQMIRYVSAAAALVAVTGAAAAGAVFALYNNNGSPINVSLEGSNAPEISNFTTQNTTVSKVNNSSEETPMTTLSETVPPTSETNAETTSELETSLPPESNSGESPLESEKTSSAKEIVFTSYDDKQSIESWNAIAAFTAITDDAVLADKQYSYLLEQTFGNKLITDESTAERAKTLIITHNKLSKELWLAAYSPAGTDPSGISKDEKDNWFVSSKTPNSFGSMQELYELEKDTYNDISTFDDFSDKFNCFKFEDGKFYMKGHAIGHTSTFGTAFDFKALGNATVCEYGAVVDTDDGAKLAYILENVPEGKTHYFFICLADLSEADGQLKIIRNCDWENAFGKGNK